MKQRTCSTNASAQSMCSPKQQDGRKNVVMLAVIRIRSTKIAELSFIPLVAQGQSLLPCLHDHLSSSRILCGSILSRTSSGNHCRSDPVQVQSTSMCTGIVLPKNVERKSCVRKRQPRWKKKGGLCFVKCVVGGSSQADHLMRNAAMDDSIGGS